MAAHDIARLSDPKFSLIQVDEEVSFVVNNRDLELTLSAATEKHFGMSRKTYSKKHPISYNTPITLLQSKVNGNNDTSKVKRQPSLKITPKCTSAAAASSSEKTKNGRKRPLDPGLSITPVSRKMRKREISMTKLPPTRINGRITSKTQKNLQTIKVPSDPDIEIIQVIERDTSNAYKRDSIDSFNGRERNRLSDIQKKRNSKSLPSILKLCYPNNDDVPITEADIAPVIPSNSFIPHTSVSETNQNVTKPSNKWMLPSDDSDVTAVQIIETHGAKVSAVKSADKCNIYESDAKVFQERKNSGRRELKNLYANLNEIYWAKEKDFKQLLSNSATLSTINRHSERITAKSNDAGKNLRRLKARSGNQPVYTNKHRNVLAKKNSAKLALKRAKYGRSTPTLVLKKNLKYKPPINRVNKKVIPKLLVKPSKKLKVDIVKKMQPKVGIKQKTATELKPKLQIIASAKNLKVAGNPSKTKLGNISRSVGKNVLSSALKKAEKTEHEIQVVSGNASNGKVVKKFECSDIKIFGKNLGNNKAFTTAMKKGSKLRVQVEPLEHTNYWNTGFCEAFSKYVMEQTSTQLEAKNKESIKAMFEELMESWYNNQPEKPKLPKKKKSEEEFLRSSVRQSEGAFRYKEIVVKKHKNYMQFVLVPNAIKQNSLSIEAMKELREAFLLAKKDPNCRAVLLNSSGTFFCTGIDLSLLVGSNKKQAAEEMASTIKELVLTLSTFTKPVVAAVNGTAVGFGVTLLTLCDVVLASDKATFCIPATRLGYLPEGAITLTLPQVVGSTVATELLLYGRRLTADQALRHGLVSEVLWHSNLMNEVVPRVQVIVSQPLQVMEATKTMVRCQLWDRLRFHMEREWRLLPPLWLDAQCQNNIKKALQTGWLID